MGLDPGLMELFLVKKPVIRPLLSHVYVYMGILMANFAYFAQK